MPPKEELILRDTLAIDRTRLANQRTLLSFIRTGLYLIVTALGIYQFSHTSRFYWTVWILAVLGGMTIVIGITNYLLMRKKVQKAYSD
jgi:putative membrane protein